MTLLEQCVSLTKEEAHQLSGRHEIGRRLMCPEYSLTVQEVKPYPASAKNCIFAICWHLEEDNEFYATLRPYDFDFCYHCSYIPATQTQLHTHAYLELGYIVQGEFRQNILGHPVVFHAGDFCLIDKNCLHQDYIDAGSATILFFGIENEMFDEIMDADVTVNSIITFLQTALRKQNRGGQYIHFKPLKKDRSQMEECISALLRELCINDKASYFLCKGLLIRIFHMLGIDYEFHLSRDLQKEMNSVMYEEIADYIHIHFADITIKDLIQTFHFQEDYFNRLIKSKTGLTYTEYVQKIRLEEAEQLLRSSEQTIEQVADAVGYHNMGYFYKIFRKAFGTTPSRYRKLLRDSKS